MIEITEEELQDIFNEGVELGSIASEENYEMLLKGSPLRRKLTDSEILKLVRGEHV